MQRSASRQTMPFIRKFAALFAWFNSCTKSFYTTVVDDASTSYFCVATILVAGGVDRVWD
jgi:hypothetical protein